MPDDLRVPLRPEELPTDFVFQRIPMRHQLRDWLRFRNLPYFALFYEQRARKTKVALDIFRYRYERGEVEALVVIAYPNGVHRVWLDELPKEFPPELYARTRALAWASGRSTNKTEREKWLALRDYHGGPIIVTFNCEAIIGTQPAAKYFEWFVYRRKVMLVADEASWLANWSKRTQRVIAFGNRPNVIVKAILDGTPVEEGPGEIYYPSKFLREGLLGYTTPSAFRARYFEYEEEDLVGPDGEVIGRQRVRRQRHGPGGKVLQEYEVFKGYRYLEELEKTLKTFGARVRRADVSDAPPKTYQSRYFDLTPKQRKVYEDLRDRYAAGLVDGRQVTAANVLLRMTRLQMVARNYYPPEREGASCPACQGVGYSEDGISCARCGGIGLVVRVSELVRIDPDRNPAAEALMEEIRSSRTPPTVVWCCFRQDVLDVIDATRAVGLKFHRYDGGLSENEREEAYQAFKAGDGHGIVGTLASGLQRGKDLSRAAGGLVAYYSNVFALRVRRQSEDRTESVEQTASTGVVDLVAADTRDLKAIEALREKRSIAEMIMGDPHEKWI